MSKPKLGRKRLLAGFCIVLSLCIVLALITFYIIVGSENRAKFFLARSEAASNIGLKSLSHWLLHQAAKESAHSTVVMEARLKLADVTAEAGSSMCKKAQDIAWQVVEDFCALPPAGNISATDEESEGETLCKVALVMSFTYKERSEGNTFDLLGFSEEILALKETVSLTQNDNIKALARSMIISRKQAENICELMELPKDKRKQLIEKQYEEAAEKHLALFREFPDTYWGVNSLLKAAAHHAKKGEIEIAKQEYQIVQRKFPNTILEDRAKNGILSLEKIKSENYLD